MIWNQSYKCTARDMVRKFHKEAFHFKGATLFGQLKIGQLFFGQLDLANYLMQIRLDFKGLKI